ncbi:hypothetical protein [Cysteiniphilum halobium]|uniref:hypothetical protein n=1 Tax=Cysteiniphilum halobium TaxID=2219059 RepID=UPI000E64E0E1|nr:hypothetical protein [Cysteiniphilum halobium]
MSFKLDNTVFYAKKNDGNKYTLYAIAHHDFYAKDNWNNQTQDAYLLNVKALQQEQRKKVLKKGKNNEFELSKTEYTAEELKAIFGKTWQDDKNKIEFDKEINYNFAKLTNLKHIDTEKEAQSLVDILNARLKDNSTTDAVEEYKLKKFTKDQKENKAIYQLTAGRQEYTVIQNHDGSTNIKSNGDPIEFSNRLLETADLLRANTKANLKSQVMGAIKDITDSGQKYEIAKKMLGILTPQPRVANEKIRKLSQPSELVSENDKSGRKEPEAGMSAPTITFENLAPIYKKKDNNKDDEYLDYEKYQQIADNWHRKGYRINAQQMIGQKDDQGNFLFSENARKELTDIFDIHNKRNEDMLKTFCGYYMGEQVQDAVVRSDLKVV